MLTLFLWGMTNNQTMTANELESSCSKVVAESEPVLCYVNKPWAFFTTQELSEQWGDDWDDAPYEHNAEVPYGYGEHDRKAGRKPWRIVKIAWDADLEEPCESHINSPWAVNQINAGAIAWLRSNRWAQSEPVVIPAGTPLRRFCELIRKAGGDVYLKKDDKDRDPCPICGDTVNQKGCHITPHRDWLNGKECAGGGKEGGR